MTNTAAARKLTSQPTPPTPLPPALSPSELGRWAWRQLTSMRTALILLLMLGLAAIPGSLIPQNRVDALAVANWQAAHPGLTPIYERLGLFRVYSSVWFSAIYILLMVSLVGCILPRLRVYWRGATQPPPMAPRNLSRLPAYRSAALLPPPTALAARAGKELRRRRFRIRITGDEVIEVSAQRGYLREAGNLLFHLSVVLVLVAFAVGNLFGFRGGVIVVDGQTFTNTVEAYDDFAPGALFRPSQLAPFNFTLDKFQASFVNSGPEAGIPSAFDANLTFRTGPGATPQQDDLQVNHPLRIGSTSVFLVGNGYAPVITVRDGVGKVVYSGPTVFLPLDPSYASIGVVKAPDARPKQLAFDGEFLPTYGRTKAGGPYSQFPDTLAPVLSLDCLLRQPGLGQRPTAVGLPTRQGPPDRLRGSQRQTTDAEDPGRSDPEVAERRRQHHLQRRPSLGQGPSERHASGAAGTRWRGTRPDRAPGIAVRADPAESGSESDRTAPAPSSNWPGSIDARAPVLTPPSMTSWTP